MLEKMLEVAWNAIEKMGYLFYIVDPSKTFYEHVEDLPNFTLQALPAFMIMSVIEQTTLTYQKKPITRLNDGIASISQGILEELSKIFFRGWFLVTYVYVYNNWRIITLPWNSYWTWISALIVVDFIYYWGHRACHEINFLWATHQVHHSSEEYNLSTALRQPIFQNYILTLLNVPMALAFPPSFYVVHHEFNLLFQFWVHTEIIDSLGPLEYIFNTASHHRVHHGRNRYCIDKNYAGTLIIWDRIFGTFAPEKEKVVYGLVHPINTFEPVYIQFCHYMHILRTLKETSGFRNKLSVIFKGPGWAPGLPWHGRLEDIPDIKGPVEKYNPSIPQWCKIYVSWHFVTVVLGYVSISILHNTFSSAAVYAIVGFEVFSLSTLGMLNDARSYGPWIELIRCFTFIILDYFFIPVTALVPLPGIYQTIVVLLVRMTFLVSVLGWMKICIKAVSVRLYSNNKMD